MTKDNFLVADEIMYQMFELLINKDNPLSERDAWFAKEINRLGEKVIAHYTPDELFGAGIV